MPRKSRRSGLDRLTWRPPTGRVARAATASEAEGEASATARKTPKKGKEPKIGLRQLLHFATPLDYLCLLIAVPCAAGTGFLQVNRHSLAGRPHLAVNTRGTPSPCPRDRCGSSPHSRFPAISCGADRLHDSANRRHQHFALLPQVSILFIFGALLDSLGSTSAGWIERYERRTLTAGHQAFTRSLATWDGHTGATQPHPQALLSHSGCHTSRATRTEDERADVRSIARARARLLEPGVTRDCPRAGDGRARARNLLARKPGGLDAASQY